MAKNISEQDIRKAVAKVKHPAIDNTLAELGMIDNITFENNKVIVTIAFPVPNVPIRDRIIESVRKPIADLGAECEIRETIMTEQDRGIFLDKEQKNWKGNA
ncbi:MAG: DUF59 domain-containing protein [Candidatus Omnitrophica bacterium]|nr:DUF59 domain-containing protein [Candidatus Omnitrophota bacterium]